ncbi:CDP-alcohol phosphatidyltransferase family protein [Nanoarchaeota archaeon]
MQIKVMNYFKRRINDNFSSLFSLLYKLKVRAAYLTALSFIFGLLAVYFLFESNGLFVVFGLLHMIFDIFDGSLARSTGTVTRFGAYFDNGSDRTIVLLMLLKSFIYFDSYWILLIILVFVLHHLVFISKKLDCPVVYSRSVVLMLYFFQFYYVGYVVVGVFSLYGLLKQIKSFFSKA